MSSRAIVSARAGVTIGVVCLRDWLLVPAPVFAGDNTTLFFFEETEIDADPGETIELELVVSDHGDYNANGIDELGFELLRPRRVHRDRPRTRLDAHRRRFGRRGRRNERDRRRHGDDHRRTGARSSGDGARATETAVTITLEVAEDAEPTTETIEISDAFATLVTDYPQAVIERDATVSVDGGPDQPTTRAPGPTTRTASRLRTRRHRTRRAIRLPTTPAPERSPTPVRARATNPRTTRRLRTRSPDSSAQPLSSVSLWRSC
ncbi:hypothetical protein D8S78_12885 [Natrialba swarupiae]|nr:hypothetical protein [Natrialba swarupiae]